MGGREKIEGRGSSVNADGVEHADRCLDSKEASCIGGEGAQHDRSESLVHTEHRTRPVSLDHFGGHIAHAPWVELRADLDLRLHRVEGDREGPVEDTGHTSTEESRKRSRSIRPRGGELPLEVLVGREVERRCDRIPGERRDESPVNRLQTRVTPAGLLPQVLREIPRSLELCLVLLHLENTLEPLTRGKDGGRKEGRSRPRHSDLVELELLEGVSVTEHLLTKTVPKEAQRVHRRHPHQGSTHAPVQGEGTFFRHRLLKAVEGALVYRLRLHPHLNRVQRVTRKHQTHPSEPARKERVHHTLRRLFHLLLDCHLYSLPSGADPSSIKYRN
eukprot:Hpha_TRINITY_DN8291_c0_g1::TRINITY_DN8291_c0_g1_i1::g.111971::m.111971